MTGTSNHSFVIGNEFARVEIIAAPGTHGPRLVVRDTTSGRQRLIDPLVLEALVLMSDDEMARLADPNLVTEESGR